MAWLAALRALLRQLDRLARKHPLTSDEAVAGLRARGVLRWNRKDPNEPNVEWFGLKEGLLRINTSNGELRRYRGVLGIDPIQSVGGAFTPKLVLIGTQGGLVAYVRGNKSWNRIAPGGEYGVIEAPVVSLKQNGGTIHVTYRLGGGSIATWRYAGGKWVEE
jgi:hypothetical protein